MRCVAFIEQRQVAAIEAHPVEVLEVDVLALLAAVAAEPHQALLFIDFDDPARAELAPRDRILELAVETVEVEMRPARALRPPDELLALVEVADALRNHADVGEALGEQRLEVAGLGVNDAVLNLATHAVAAQYAQLTVGKPARIEVALVLPLRLEAGELAGALREHHQLAVADLVLTRHRVLVLLQRWPWLGQRVDEEQLGDIA